VTNFSGKNLDNAESVGRKTEHQDDASQRGDLPEGWSRTTLGDFISISSGEGLVKSNMENGSVPVYGGNGITGWHNESNIREKTIVIGRVGFYCGSIHLTPKDAWVTDNAFITKFSEASINRMFLYRLLTSTNLRADDSGTAQPVISGRKVYPIEVWLAPLAEQQQIAQKLDELLAQVDTLKTRLEAIPKILKRFRQSVLAAAVSGRLTEEWRNFLPYKAEKNKMDFFVGIDVGYAFKSAQFSDAGVKLLRGQNIEPGSLRWLETKCYPEDQIAGLEHLYLKEADIILAMDRPIVSAGLKLARVKKSDLPCILVQRVARFKDFEGITPDYLYLLLSSFDFLNYIQPNQTGSDIPHISGKQILDYEILVPALSEQTEIVRRVEQLFAYADQIEQRVKDAQARVNHLTQSILAKAFRGELTADWRAENPELISGENSAAALLGRIKAERDKVSVKRKRVK